MKRMVVSAAVTAATLLFAVTATAQTAEQRAHRQVALAPGFADRTLDSWSMSSYGIRALPGCPNGGNIHTYSSVTLTVADTLPSLNISVTSGHDTLLIVSDPQANLTCNDDTSGLNPALHFNNLPAGEYTIYIGNFLSTARGTNYFEAPLRLRP
tara:strand:+ start:2261 stop:2722 length:462 start_codon:yes stop_codon:yes gene_type:complete